MIEAIDRLPGIKKTVRKNTNKKVCVREMSR